MALLDFLKGGSPVAMPTDQAQPDSLEALQQVMAGNISGQLTTADKLAGLSALMRSVTRQGRQAGLTPEAAIQGVQQQALQRIQGQMQVEQLRAAQAQRQAQAARVQQFAAALPESQRNAFEGLPLEQQVARMEQEAFRQRQLFQVFKGEDGKTYERYQNGDIVESSVQLPANREYLKMDVTGDGVNELVLVDKESKEPVLDTEGKPRTMRLGMDPAAAGNLNVAQARLARDLSRPRGGGGGGGGSAKRNAPTEITTTGGRRAIAEFDPKTRQYYAPGTNTVIPRVAGSSDNSLEARIAGAIARQRAK